MVQNFVSFLERPRLLWRNLSGPRRTERNIRTDEQRLQRSCAIRMPDCVRVRLQGGSASGVGLHGYLPRARYGKSKRRGYEWKETQLASLFPSRPTNYSSPPLASSHPRTLLGPSLIRERVSLLVPHPPFVFLLREPAVALLALPMIYNQRLSFCKQAGRQFEFESNLG